MIDELLSILNTVGQVADTPWAMLRTGIAKRDPMAGLQAAYDWDSRSSGSDLLTSLGAPENQPGLDWMDVAGAATEIIPDMILPGAGAYKALKWLRPAEEAGVSTRAVLDAIDKVAPQARHVSDAIPEHELMQLLNKNPIIDAADDMLPALPAPRAAAQAIEEVAPAAKSLPQASKTANWPVDEVAFFNKPRPEKRFPATKAYKSLYFMTDPKEVKKLVELIEPLEPGSPFRRISTAGRGDLAKIHPEVAKDWLALLESKDPSDIAIVKALTGYAAK